MILIVSPAEKVVNTVSSPKKTNNLFVMNVMKDYMLMNQENVGYVLRNVKLVMKTRSAWNTQKVNSCMRARLSIADQAVVTAVKTQNSAWNALKDILKKMVTASNASLDVCPVLHGTTAPNVTMALLSNTDIVLNVMILAWSVPKMTLKFVQLVKRD